MNGVGERTGAFFCSAALLGRGRGEIGRTASPRTGGITHASNAFRERMGGWFGTPFSIVEGTIL